jgi:hypothetical protein
LFSWLRGTSWRLYRFLQPPGGSRSEKRKLAQREKRRTKWKEELEMRNYSILVIPAAWFIPSLPGVWLFIFLLKLNQAGFLSVKSPDQHYNLRNISYHRNRHKEATGDYCSSGSFPLKMETQAKFYHKACHLTPTSLHRTRTFFPQQFFYPLKDLLLAGESA